MAGQDTTGSAMLLVAESVQSAVDSAIKDEDISLAEKLKDTWTIEHFVNTAAALSKILKPLEVFEKIEKLKELLPECWEGWNGDNFNHNYNFMTPEDFAETMYEEVA